MWAWRVLVRSYFEVVLIYVIYGRFTIKIHGFMHSLRSFLAHAAHGTIVMDNVQIYRG